MDAEIVQVAESAPVAGETTQLEWRPVAGLAEISFKNFFLRLPTLGLYYFWGKTNLRRNLWGSVHLQGQPLEYTGKGWELFVGFLITMVVVFLPLGAAAVGLTLLFGKMFGATDPRAQLGILLLYPIFFYLIGVAQYRARNYRLSRTNWRGIRGHMAGSSWKYGWTFFWTTLVSLITLGWAMPWQATKLQTILTNDTRFGEEPLRFDALAKPLYLPFAIAWFAMVIGIGGIVYLIKGIGQKAAMAKALGVPVEAVMSPIEGGLLVLGIIALPLLYAVVSAFSISRKSNYFARHTHIQNARFELKTTPMSLIWLVLGNFFYIVLTLGMLSPIAQRRLASYIVGRASIEGAIDFDAISQSQAKIAKTGEGLAEAFDIDAF
ncbi:MAG: DUF898 domain-containing protein [Hyphomicrobiaceae bacterium]|nr:DUF898 domain-containing protein [Hyphomicrobiaceae bacterium]